jgi:hypothetical protein
LEGRPQRYGTQFDWDAAGQLSPLPIEDQAGVDERRQTLGLRPLKDELAAQLDAAVQSGERSPADWEARQREVDVWLRDVGWRR